MDSFPGASVIAPSSPITGDLSPVQPLMGVIHLTLSLTISSAASDTFSFYLLRPAQPQGSLWGQDLDSLMTTFTFTAHICSTGNSPANPGKMG